MTARESLIRHGASGTDLGTSPDTSRDPGTGPGATPSEQTSRSPYGGPFRCGRFRFAMDRPLVMGILNVTPDSFSDGGRHARMDDAIAAAQRMIGDGVDIIDVGAESTRPGSTAVDEVEEWRRLEPVLKELVTFDCAISVDTRHARTMRRAARVGVDLLNDIEGFRGPASIAALVESECGACVMHMKGDPATMQLDPHYDDVVREVRDFLADQCRALRQAGVCEERLCIDPGFGFGKSLEHNLVLLQRLDELQLPPHVMLVGLSRKSVIGTLTRRPPAERIGGSLGAALAAVSRGAGIVRVHDVAATVDALRIWDAVNVIGAGVGPGAGPEPGARTGRLGD